MAGIPRFRLFLPQLGVIAPLLRVFAETVQVLVHLGHTLVQRLAVANFVFGKLRLLAVLLGFILSLLVGLEFLVFAITFILHFEKVCIFLAAAEADAVAVTIAGIHGGAVDFMACEDVVPDVFKDSARELVVHARGEQPLPIVNEAFNRHLLDALAGCGKLGTAYAGEGGWNRGARVDLLPDVTAPVNFLGLVVEVEVAAGAVHVDPVGAAGVVVAAHIHVAHTGNALVVEAFDHGGSVEAEQHVVVPGMAVGMHEDGCVGEVMVVVDEVAEIDLRAQLVGMGRAMRQQTHHGLAALVLGDLVLGMGVVDLVDDQGRVGQLARHPGYVLILGLGYHNLVRVVASWWLGLAVAEAQRQPKVERVAAH